MNLILNKTIPAFRAKDDYAFCDLLLLAGVRIAQREEDSHHLYHLAWNGRAWFLCIPHAPRSSHTLLPLPGNATTAKAQYHALAVHYGGATAGANWQAYPGNRPGEYRVYTRDLHGTHAHLVYVGADGRPAGITPQPIGNTLVNALCRDQPLQELHYPEGRARLYCHNGAHYALLQDFADGKYLRDATLLPPGAGAEVAFLAQAFAWGVPLPDGWNGRHLHSSCLLLQRDDMPQVYAARLHDRHVSGLILLPDAESEICLSANLRSGLLDRSLTRHTLAAVHGVTLCQWLQSQEYSIRYALLGYDGAYYALEAWGGEDFRICRLGSETEFVPQILRWLGDYPWFGDAATVLQSYGVIADIPHAA
mgnify:CR=1 FL=1